MFKCFYRRVASNLRYRLLALVLFPILLVMPAVTGMAYLWSNEVSYQQLLMKVSTDLSVAHQAFERSQRDYLQRLSRVAESYPFQQAAQALFSARPDSQPLEVQLAKLRQRAEFDFVYLVDADGCDLLGLLGCYVKRAPLMARAGVENGSAGVTLFSNLELRHIDPALAARVYLPLRQAPQALSRAREAEDRGMVLLSYYPLRDTHGELRGYLAAGVLVNGNFAFVDGLKQLVYDADSLIDSSLGTVTVFLGDVRINTNVPSQLARPSERALGTLVSQEVREQVLERGEKWIDRAFVVSEWYISAYEPIVDIDGERIGMLYAGFLEAPFKESYFQALRWLAILFVLVTLLSVGLAVAGAKSIFKPIEAMARVMRQVRHGQEVRIGPLDTHDELCMLARQFDAMLDQLSRQRQQIRADAEQLELKVTERTEQLQQRSIDLQRNLDLLKRTRQQLVAKEKLAAIGELTAGIAHEINNPTAVILGNMDLMMLELAETGAPVKREAELIVEQVYRIRAIITNLLQYSRPNDYRAELSLMDLNRLVSDTLVLVRHDLSKKSIRLKLDLRASHPLRCNPQQLQQVLINLIVNAVSAMVGQERSGQLTLRSRNRGDGVVLVVKDNGCGIDSRVLPRIFDPFFTRTQGGSGLGLSVSYGILERLGAEISVRSRPGVGSCFFVWLPLNPRVDEAEEALIRSVG